MYQITKCETFADSTVVSTRTLPELYPSRKEALVEVDSLVDNFIPYHPSYPVTYQTTKDGRSVSTKYGRSIQYTVSEANNAENHD